MKSVSYRIADEIFVQHPVYCRGVVVAYGVQNKASPDTLRAMLSDVSAELRQKLTLEQLPTHPQIANWRDAYRSFGAKPSEFRCSIEAMARRILKDQSLPSINALVDIGNIVSLKYLVPVGSHALDDISSPLTLRLAQGNEVFVPFGSDSIEHPVPGEIIFAEGNTVLTRRWTWRQANHTLTVLDTRAVEFNIDGLSPVCVETVKCICEELVRLIQVFCDGTASYHILDKKNQAFQINLSSQLPKVK